MARCAVNQLGEHGSEEWGGGLQATLRVHPTKLAGASVQDKLQLLRNDLSGTRKAPSVPNCEQCHDEPAANCLTGPSDVINGVRPCMGCWSQCTGGFTSVRERDCGSAEQGVGAVIITALDEVAWLLNLRGGDVDYNPIFISYAIVTPEAATLYIDSAKVSS